MTSKKSTSGTRWRAAERKARGRKLMTIYLPLEEYEAFVVHAHTLELSQNQLFRQVMARAREAQCERSPALRLALKELERQQRARARAAKAAAKVVGEPDAEGEPPEQPSQAPPAALAPQRLLASGRCPSL